MKSMNSFLSSDNSDKFKSLKKVGLMLLVFVLVASIVLTGCSTPELAATVKNKGGEKTSEFTTGEYLALMFTLILTQGYYEDVASGSQPTGNYSLEKTWTDVKKDHSLLESTETSVTQNMSLYDAFMGDLRFRMEYIAAVEQRIKDMNITISQNEIDEAMASYSGYAEGSALGFNEKSLERIITSNVADMDIFESLYFEGGERAVSKEDIEKHTTEKYISYKIIDFAMQDSDGVDLTGEALDKLNERIDGYKKLYDDNKDFNATIKKFKEDSEETYEDKEGVAEIDKNLNNASYTETNTLHAEIYKMKYDEVKIIEYVSGATKKKSIVLRVDPLKAADFTSEEAVEGIIYTLKYEEYLTEMKGLAANYTVEIDSKAIKQCHPANFYKEQ